MSFTCERCGYETTNKSNIARHLKSKIPCTPTNTDIDRQQLILKLFEREYKTDRATCPLCSKVCCKSQLARHRKLCSAKQHRKHQPSQSQPSSSNEPQVTMEEFLKLKAELEQLKQQIHGSSQASTSGVINNTNNSHNNSHNTNNININIQLNNFGQENTSYLTPEFLTYCLTNPKKGMSSLIESIHYNKDFPENHNLRCKSLKNNIFEKFENTQWTLCDASNTLDELIKKGYRILESHFAEHYLSDPDFFDNEDRAEAIQRFRHVLTDKTSQDYHAVKRDLRLLVKDKTMYLLELVEEAPQTTESEQQ